MAGTGELVKMALAEFEVQAGFLEIEDFFLKEGLAEKQFLNAVKFGKDVGLVFHARYFFEQRKASEKSMGSCTTLCNPAETDWKSSTWLGNNYS